MTLAGPYTVKKMSLLPIWIIHFPVTFGLLIDKRSFALVDESSFKKKKSTLKINCLYVFHFNFDNGNYQNAYLKAAKTSICRRNS